MNQYTTKNSTQTHPVVTAVATMEAQGLFDRGNFIPHQLTAKIGREVRHKHGQAKFRVDRVARDIFGHVLFWYRPGRDGGKKFNASLPQLSRTHLATAVGCSVVTVSRKLKFLSELGLIEVKAEHSTKDTHDGRGYHTTLFISLKPDVLRQVMVNMTAPPAQVDSTPVSTRHDPPVNLTAPPCQVDTVTESQTQGQKKETTQTQTDPPAAVTPSASVVCDSTSLIGASPQTPKKEGKSSRLDNFLLGWCRAYEIQFSRKYNVTDQEKQIVQDLLEEAESDSVSEVLWVAILSWNNERETKQGVWNSMFHCQYGRDLGTFVSHFNKIDKAVNQDDAKQKGAKGVLKQTILDLGEAWMNEVCPGDDERSEGDGRADQVNTEARDNYPGLDKFARFSRTKEEAEAKAVSCPPLPASEPKSKSPAPKPASAPQTAPPPRPASNVSLAKIGVLDTTYKPGSAPKLKSNGAQPRAHVSEWVRSGADVDEGKVTR